VLRYHVPVGAKARGQVTVRSSMQMNMGGMAAPTMELPVMSNVTDIEVTSVTAAGDIAFTTSVSAMKIDTSNVDPRLAAAMKDKMPQIQPMAGSGTMSPRGEPRDLAFDASKQSAEMQAMLQQTNDAMRQSIAMLPLEAVGVGAQWDSVATMRQNGMEMLMKARFEVVSIDGDRVQLKSKGTMSASTKTMQIPNLPPDADIDVHEVSGDVAGTMECDLGTLVSKADLKMTMRLSLDVKMQGQSLPMSMVMTMQMGMTPVK